MQQFVRNKLKKKFLEDGYCIFNIGDDKLIDKINADIDNLIKKKNLKLIVKFTHITNHLELLKVTNFREVVKNCQRIQRLLTSYILFLGKNHLHFQL